MAETTHTLKMATATKEDIKRLYLLNNVLGNLGKYDATKMADFEHFEEDEKQKIKRIFNEDGEIELDDLIRFLYGLTFGFGRVVMGFEVLFENCCDPALDHLDFKPSIKAYFEELDKIGEDLRAKGTVVINAESEAGKKILELTKEEEEVANG